MVEAKLYDLGYCEEKEYTRVVCVSKYQGNLNIKLGKVFILDPDMNIGIYSKDLWNEIHYQ